MARQMESTRREALTDREAEAQPAGGSQPERVARLEFLLAKRGSATGRRGETKNK